MLRDRLSDALSDVRYRARAMFRRAAVERELEEELAFHIEREARKLEASGLSANDALRQARLAFGGVERIKDDTRDARGVSWLEIFTADVRYAARGLRASPGFTLAAVLTLGLGLGANVAMFGIVDRLLLRAPPYLRDADRVHRIYLTSRDGDREVTDGTTEYARYLDFARLSRSIDVAAVTTQRKVAIGVGESTHEMPVGIVSASFWELFDASPAIGRFFTARDDSVPMGSPVTVLSYALWQTQYGGAPNVIGQSVQIGPTVCTIIGVAPPGFVGIADEGAPAAFIPATLLGYQVSLRRGRIDYHTSYNWGWLSIVVRRKPGVSTNAATADLTNAYRLSWEAQRVVSPNTPAVDVAQPHASIASVVRERGPNASPVARIAVWIAGVATVVLLIACANVANLLLARALFRRREIALRLALGASRGRLVGQLMTETLVLSALGGVAGLAAAHWGGAVLRSLFLSEAGNVTVVRDGRTLAFAGAAAVFVGLLTGLAPALQAGRHTLAPTLKVGAREGTYQRSRTRSVLLVLQGMLSVVLLVGAGLFVRSLQNVRGLRLGYDVDQLLYIQPNPRGLRMSASESAQLARRLVEEATTMPEVASAARGISVPFWSTEGTGFYVPGVDSIRRLGTFTVQMASARYFETMGTRVLRGRGIDASDRADGSLVAVVSEGMAKAVWPGKDALGACIMLDSRSAPCRTVVGVVENIQQNSLTEAQTLQFYVPIEQLRPEEAILFVRTRGNAADYADAVRRRLQPLMPGTGYVTVMPMRDILDPRQRSWQVGATMFVMFGTLALVLAAVGLYSVVAYTVAQRTQEIGVRIALGAQARDVVRLVLGEGIRFAAAGVALGVAVALAASRWIGPLLFSVSPTDVRVYALAATVLLAAAALASALPALRASRVDPNVALRSE
ncbi:MAG TPA: ADOP family duplicated permease [Gemmatimonadaceae bacterium]|nr:ADOP family duplicated permease [Gemmatimonadaceae bacterium]